jgi:hypothetical protein
VFSSVAPNLQRIGYEGELVLIPFPPITVGEIAITPTTWL